VEQDLAAAKKASRQAWQTGPSLPAQNVACVHLCLCQVFTYDERQVCAVRPHGLSPEGVSRQLISLSNDTVAAAAGCSVHCYETAQGRPVGEVLTFNQDVKAVCLSQVSTLCFSRHQASAWQEVPRSVLSMGDGGR
jgi:hypothetical protein